MLELSLHILDIVNNSVKAKADLIKISIHESLEDNLLKIVISDNGIGMDPDFLAKVTDPFQTTRTTRKVGMGLSLYKAAAENAGGDFAIHSQKDVGTTVEASFQHDHIDRQPLGDMAETIITLVSGNDTIHFVYTHVINEKEFRLDTREVKQILGDDISLGDPEIVLWLKEYIHEGLNSISL